MGNKNLKAVNSFIISATLTAVFITAITVTGELEPLIKNWLKDIFLHHWIGKGILSAVLFLATNAFCLIISKQPEEKTIIINLNRLFWIVCLGFAVILSFYVYETFKH